MTRDTLGSLSTASHQAAGPEARDIPPLFILGAPRSGTTLFSQMLTAHSQIAIPYESHFIVPLYHEYGSREFETPADRRLLVERILEQPYVKQWDVPLTVEDVNLDGCLNLAGGVDAVFSAYATRHGKNFWADKTPGYTVHADVLNRLFPHCKFIHIIRDGRDVALSLIRQHWGPNDFVGGIRYWREMTLCCRKMLSMLDDDRSFEFRFEDLVAEPEGILRQVTQFVGLPFESTMVDEYVATATRRIGSKIEMHEHILRAPALDQTYKWKKSLGKADQAIAFELAGDLFSELGYESGVKSHPLKPIRKLWHKAVEWRRWRNQQSPRLESTRTS